MDPGSSPLQSPFLVSPFPSPLGHSHVSLYVIPAKDYGHDRGKLREGLYVIPAKAGIQSLFPLRNALVLGAWPAGRPGPFLWIPAKNCGNDRGGNCGKDRGETAGMTEGKLRERQGGNCGKDGVGGRWEGREAGGKDGEAGGKDGVAGGKDGEAGGKDRGRQVDTWKER